jgi:DNA polymerase III gamma/tau subunit
MDLTVKVQELLGDAIVYDKKSRTLVLEFDSIRDAIQALNILPFGLNYKIYLLDA